MSIADHQDPFVRVLKHLKNTITASHIAAFPVRCWLPFDNVSHVREKIARDCLDFTHVPVRDHEGRIRWLARREELNDKEGQLKDYANPFNEKHIIDSNRPLRDTLRLLRDHRVLLVRSPESGQPDGISGIINDADVQKTPVRLLLFTQLTEIEARLRNRLSRKNWEDDSQCASFVTSAKDQRRDPEGRLPLINHLNISQVMKLARACSIRLLPELSEGEWSCP